MTPHLSHPKYRPDIDGLRAIAVLSVVGFHAFPDWITGGFVGVDVFFVISGYLISTILFKSLDRGTFSFSEFYARRIKRIFPALLLVLISCYLFGWFALLADEYKQLGKHIAAGAGFVSNLFLWQEAGYFDNSADTKPLLHLWSLGIEEQFYIIWPILLWVTWKRKLNYLIVTVFFAAVSFYLNIRGIKKDEVATFYSPLCRFWELQCGSLLAWFTLYRKEAYTSFKLKIDRWLTSTTYHDNVKNDGQRLSNILSLLGMLVLAIGFWSIDKNIGFPGKWAVVPVLGAVFIILAGSHAWINRVILSSKIAVWFGLISFPLYLWHWPILSFARIVQSETPSPVIRISAIILSIILAWCTYKLIERPIRSAKHSKAKVSIPLVIMIATGCVGYATLKGNGFAFRLNDREDFISYYENSFPDWQYFKKINITSEWRSECAFFNGKKYLEEHSLVDKPLSEIDPSCYKRDERFEKSVLIWGDSHAQALSPGIVKYMPKNWQILQIASSGCAPNPDATSPSSTSQCDQSNYFAIKTIKDAKPDVVIVAQAKGHSANTMTEIERRLESLGVKRILFLGPTPQWTADLPKIFARKLWLQKPRRTFIGLDQEVMENNAKVSREFHTNNIARYVDVSSLFCDTEGCLIYTDDNNIKESITTWDYGHMTPSTSKYLSKNLLINLIIAK